VVSHGVRSGRSLVFVLAVALGALAPGIAAAQTAEIARGRVAMLEGRYDDAAAAATSAATDPSTRVDAQTLLGEARMARGRLDEAETAFRAVEDDEAAHRARVMLGRLLIRRGRDGAARVPLMRVIRAYNDDVITRRDAAGLAYVGMAAAMLGSAHDANDAFTQAARADRTRAETQLEWAELFLEHEDAGHAEECVRDALAASPNDARAHALSARVLLAQSFDFAGARRAVDEALAVNPSLVMAHVTLANLALRDLDLVTADRHLDDALAIDPTDLEALSVRAAVRFVEGNSRAFETALSAVLAQNPRFSHAYSIIADHADWEHRYADIVTLARRALALDPHDARAEATLGINLLREGEETDGLEALRHAFARDAFNVRVYNLLNLFEGALTRDYETFDARPFVFRMHREERPVLSRYVPRTLAAAYADMRRRYHFTPRGPIHMELFATTQHFAVRTSGLPSLGAQGVCFGRVVTALSPRGGEFDWAEITTHELSHVFHVQLSHSRVPRWFTEGLAEHETNIARPEWRREDDHRLYRYLTDGRLPPLRDMNAAFTHARSADGMLTAYYAASRVVAYLDERFGFPALVTMLREWGRGRSTEEVFTRALHVDVDTVDADFRAAELARLSRYTDDFTVDLTSYDDLEGARARAAASPSDAVASAELAAAALGQGEAVEALRAAQAAVLLDPHQPIARFVLASLGVTRHDAAETETHLADLRASGHVGYDLEIMAAGAAIARSDAAGARAALERAIALDPGRIDAHHALYLVSGESSDVETRLREARVIVTMDEHAREPLAFLLDQLDARGETVSLDAVVERTIYADPERARGHELLARSYLRRGRGADALYEVETWALLAPNEVGPVALLRAEALHALHRDREARAAIDAAVSADPTLRARADAILGP
jgi:tetratricopeptide (TPR) repeat protein